MTVHSPRPRPFGGIARISAAVLLVCVAFAPAHAQPAHVPKPVPAEPDPTTVTSPSAPAFAPIPGLQTITADKAKVVTIGSLLPPARPEDPPYRMQVELSGWGAGIQWVHLSQYRDAAIDGKPFRIIDSLPDPDSADAGRVYPFKALAVTINGTRVDLSRSRWELIEPLDHRLTRDPPEQASPGSAPQPVHDTATYAITIADGDRRPVLEVRRTYRLDPDSYDLGVHCRFINRTDQPIQIVWEQNATSDLPNDDAAYLGDHRSLVTGYFDLDYDPQARYVYDRNAIQTRAHLMDGKPLWPNPAIVANSQLVWFATLNRYFAAVVHRPLADIPSSLAAGAGPPADAPASLAAKTARAQAMDDLFLPPVVLTLGPKPVDGKDRRVLLTRLTTRPITLAPSSAAEQAIRDLDLGLYVGPRKSSVFHRPPYDTLGLDALVRYELGCTWCTFQWLARLLLGFLKAIHFVFADWGIAIIVLVLFVRLLLHPLTKKSQIQMTKLGKQMAMLKPELDKLKKKFGDDPKKMQAEQARLYREKGVNPLNMLGCAPMFLQMPIWVALYAMLYFAVELRHQPAFYGVFQLLGGQNWTWTFLADLSSADNFIRFPGEGYTLNLLFIHPHFAGVNVIPILMGVLFFFQQRYMSTPPADEKAAQQQRMMTWMTLLFPVFLYSAPSGLTLYILASTAAGMLDSYMVKRHIEREEAAGTLFAKKPPRPGGLMDRLHKAVEARQAQISAGTGQDGGNGKGPGYKRRK